MKIQITLGLLLAIIFGAYLLVKEIKKPTPIIPDERVITHVDSTQTETSTTVTVTATVTTSETDPIKEEVTEPIHAEPSHPLSVATPEVVEFGTTIIDTLGNSAEIKVKYDEGSNEAQITANLSIHNKTIYVDNFIKEKHPVVIFAPLASGFAASIDGDNIYGLGGGARFFNRVDVILGAMMADKKTIIGNDIRQERAYGAYISLTIKF